MGTRRKTRSAGDPRINLALSPELYEYAQVMAGVRGQSVTKFINDLLDASLEENREVYSKAKELREKITM